MFALLRWTGTHFMTEIDFVNFLLTTLIWRADIACFFMSLTTPPLAAGLRNFVRITAGAMDTSTAATW